MWLTEIKERSLDKDLGERGFGPSSIPDKVSDLKLTSLTPYVKRGIKPDPHTFL